MTRDAILVALFLVDLWSIDLAVSKRQCRREGGTPVVSDATVVCLRPGGVPGGFMPAAKPNRER